MAKFKLLGRVNHDQKQYEVGESIDLQEKDSAILQQMGLIEPAGESKPEPTPEVEPEPPALVNVNTSTAQELVELDHIGDATALKIINGRPYEDLEEARLSSGLSREKWEKIESLLTL